MLTQGYYFTHVSSVVRDVTCIQTQCGHMLIPIESWEITHMHVASFSRLSESLGTRLECSRPVKGLIVMCEMIILVHFC